MQEELIALRAELVALQARFNALVSPTVTEVPSLQYVLTWIQGQLESHRLG